MPDEILPFLKELLQLPGVSGHEGPVMERIRQEWEPLVDEVSVGRLGNVQARKRGAGPGPRPSLLIAAHMDIIGFMVASLTDGFLRFVEIGGTDPRILPGQTVTVHARRPLSATIVVPPESCLPADRPEGALPERYLLIDTGLPSSQVERLVRVGDLISFAQEPIELDESTIAGCSLDNRSSIGALTIALQELQTRTHTWDVIALASTLEEVNRGGALTAAFTARPAIAVAVDVTFGRSTGVPEHKTFLVGKGPTIAAGPNVHPAIRRELMAAAKRAEIPFTDEITPPDSGTDAFTMQIAREGIPTGIVGLPLRYMHSPVELMSLTDIRRAGRLIAEFAAGLSPDFTRQVAWD